MSATSVHRPPVFPHLWLLWFAGAHVLLAALWWTWGWQAAIPVWLGSHGLLLWGTFRPGSPVLAPVLTRLPTQRREVWLTIDDGPSADTPAILDLLDAHGAKATFFLVGVRAVAQPALVRDIVRLGDWSGRPRLYDLPTALSEGEAMVVLVQDKRDRRIIGVPAPLRQAIPTSSKASAPRTTQSIAAFHALALASRQAWSSSRSSERSLPAPGSRSSVSG